MQNILGIIDSNGNLVVKYNCDAWGNHEVLDGNGNENTLESFIGNINPFRYKGYYYDKESNMYYCKSRYYVHEWCRWLNGDNVANLDTENINGMNLFSYCGNNPIHTFFNFGTSEKIVNSSSNNLIYSGNVLGSSAPYERPNLPKVPWLIDNATRMYGTLSSLSSGIPIFAHYIRYRKLINNEFKLYGLSSLKTAPQLANVDFKMSGIDKFLIVADVLIDMYDSYQRGVSIEGMLIGGALTAAAGVGLLYFNKLVICSTTAIGTAICPGLGTAIGFLWDLE